MTSTCQREVVDVTAVLAQSLEVELMASSDVVTQQKVWRLEDVAKLLLEDGKEVEDE